MTSSRSRPWATSTSTPVSPNSYLLDTEREDKFSFQGALQAQRMETGAWLAGAQDDYNYFGYLKSQFAWGKTVSSFYKHPDDDYRTIKYTKNILGK